jgi:hypothetical protein
MVMLSSAARLAFQRLAPRSLDYATLPILEGFNWDECTTGMESGTWYLVVFRSQRRPDADEALLEAYDLGAYREAQRASGLLFYFRGLPNRHGECLSFCIWETRAEARAAATLPLHRAATRIVDRMYTTFTLERYMLHRSRDGGLTTEPVG